MLERTVARWRSPPSARHHTWNQTPWAVTEASQISPRSQKPSTSTSTALPGVRFATLSTLAVGLGTPKWNCTGLRLK